MRTYNNIEDIYPLTIVGMKHGKFAVIEALSCANCISSIQEDEEWQYDLHYFMKQKWNHINYGIGNTIIEAF